MQDLAKMDINELKQVYADIGLTLLVNTNLQQQVLTELVRKIQMREQQASIVPKPIEQFGLPKLKKLDNTTTFVAPELNENTIVEKGKI